MSRPRTNFIIDAAMLLCGSAVAGIGFLMKFVLIPGKERFAVYGRTVELLFLGLDRHEWGSLHLLLALFLAGLLAVHIILHLRWIAELARSLLLGQTRGKMLAAVFLIACLLLALFAFAVQPDVREGGSGEGRGFGKGRTEHRLH